MKHDINVINMAEVGAQCYETEIFRNKPHAAVFLLYFLYL